MELATRFTEPIKHGWKRHIHIGDGLISDPAMYNDLKTPWILYDGKENKVLSES